MNRRQLMSPIKANVLSILSNPGVAIKRRKAEALQNSIILQLSMRLDVSYLEIDVV